MVFNPKAKWTPLHIKELEAMFPEQLFPESTDDVLIAIGSRRVVQYAKERMVAQQQKANPLGGRDDPPLPR